jgi:hypothetical protein
MKQLYKSLTVLVNILIVVSISLNVHAAGGQTRIIKLSPQLESPAYSSATGRVTIWWEYGEDHPVWYDFGFGFDYNVKNLECQDLGGINDGRHFYAIYATLSPGETYRIQSFNTRCQTHQLSNFRVMDSSYDATRFRNDPICIEVVIENDNGVDDDSLVVLRGTDGEGAVCR